MPVTAFLPCRAGSQRVPRKNTRPFADRQDGLLGIKLEQLLSCQALDAVVLSTNDPAVEEIAAPYVARSDGKLRIDHRPDHLCSSSTSTDEVIAYVPSIIPEGDVVWTHVTSPFFGAAEYSAAIATYRAARSAGSHDSLLGVTELRTFIWNATTSVNYDRTAEKWPRTQTLTPLYEVNSAIFIANADVYRAHGDRIGATPLLYAIAKDKTVDVDWEEDFIIAAELWRLRGKE
ncbi:acylneuraminate cytidylyltransferase family protein [Roseomonas sp. WA12]